MKKLLLASVACGVLAVATPASAAEDYGFDLELGGHFKGYVVYNDQDEPAAETRDFDILRETELHFTGEKMMDNGLTVGVHIESDIDSSDESLSGDDDFEVEESYVYFSGDWGRINFGKEDGAAYLLQVAAPSADSNVDGLRQHIQPVNYTAFGLPFTPRFDYDQAISGYDNKVTYITPVFGEGFQAGVSYTPELGDSNDGLTGVSLDDDEAGFGDAVDLAVRWEGTYKEFGITAGAGYSMASLEEEGTIFGLAQDDWEAYNVGLDVDWGPFGFGVVYKEDNQTEAFSDEEEETIVVGADYVHGPYKLGLSYFTQDNTLSLDGLETDRYAGGVVYTYGPGMTFRGSVQYIEHEDSEGIGFFGTEDEVEATSVLIGTQIRF